MLPRLSRFLETLLILTPFLFKPFSKRICPHHYCVILCLHHASMDADKQERQRKQGKGGRHTRRGTHTHISRGDIRKHVYTQTPALKTDDSRTTACVPLAFLAPSLFSFTSLLPPGNARRSVDGRTTSKYCTLW